MPRIGFTFYEGYSDAYWLNDNCDNGDMVNSGTGTAENSEIFNKCILDNSRLVVDNNYL